MWINDIVWLAVIWLVITLSVGLHELGHFVVLRAAGIKVDYVQVGFLLDLVKFNLWDTPFKISLLPFGGVNRVNSDSYKTATPVTKFFAAFAGPFVTFLIVVGCLLIAGGVGKLSELYTISVNCIYYVRDLIMGNPEGVTMMSFVAIFGGTIGEPANLLDYLQNVLSLAGSLNIAVFAFNMIPLASFDGGKMVTSFLAMIFGDDNNAINIFESVSGLTGAGLILFLIGRSMVKSVLEITDPLDYLWIALIVFLTAIYVFIRLRGSKNDLDD